ncbi:MAG: immunoglobulin domain-containing protein [Oscillospiraceae bacterium]|nr:immunoglobulin domain-containing protein [Oscillospiraceae bacterium]
MKSKRILSVLLALVFVLTLLPAVSAPALAASEITAVSITLDAPAGGAFPDYTAEFPDGAPYYSAARNEGYYRNGIMYWELAGNSFALDPSDLKDSIFRTGHKYVVRVYLTPQDGYIFSQRAYAMVNGEYADGIGWEDDGRFWLDYIFPTAPGEAPEPLGSVSVTLDAPVAGVHPDCTAELPDDAHCYTYSGGPFANGIQWTDVTVDTVMDPDSDVFQDGYVYKVSICLRPEWDYHSFSGPITVNGQSAVEDDKWILSYHDSDLYICAYTFPALTSSPSITTQPSNQTVAEGAKATFKVVASGTDPLTYQWQYSKNGTSWTDKAGATSASYTVTAKESYNGMLYRCIVTNAGGSVTSNTAKLTVTVAKPAITTQPANKTVAAGASATFQVAASGTGLTYQWQYSKNGTTWTNKTGATSASYTVTAKESYNGMLYRCIVTNAGGSVTSGTAKLTVTVAKPVITTQPKAATAAVGATATYKVVASGTGLTYQWQYSSDYGATWHNKTGATSASYTVTAKASYNGILYRCRVKNSYGTVYSESAKLTVS